MKKYFCFMLLLAMSLLAACGSTEKDAQSTTTSDAKAEATTKDETTKIATKEAIVLNAADSRLQEPKEDSVCEMCNMKVYEMNHKMGVFSAQAIKADGSISFYDDIGCLLNAERANNEKNDKYVRDYNTEEWVLVDDAIIVKTDLKSPMNWGYIYFKDQKDADQYIADNKDAKITPLKTVDAKAIERRKAIMKAKAEKEKKQQSTKATNENTSH